MRNKDGFSSIEIMIALLIIGIISALVFIRLKTYTDYNTLEKAAWSVYKDITSSRSKALKNDCPVRITFASYNSYTIHIDENSDGIVQAGETKSVYELPATVVFKLSQTAPSSAPAGASLPLQGKFAGSQWDVALVVDNKDAVAVNSGSLYMSSSRNKKYTFCIMSTAISQHVQLYKWDGTSWKNLQ